MPSVIKYPDATGMRYDYSSIRIRVKTPTGTDTSDQLGVKEISYSEELTPKDVMGTSAVRIGRTRGEQKCDASMTMYVGRHFCFMV